MGADGIVFQTDILARRWANNSGKFYGRKMIGAGRFVIVRLLMYCPLVMYYCVSTGIYFI